MEFRSFGTDWSFKWRSTEPTTSTTPCDPSGRCRPKSSSSAASPLPPSPLPAFRIPPAAAAGARRRPRRSLRAWPPALAKSSTDATSKASSKTSRYLRKLNMQIEYANLMCKFNMQMILTVDYWSMQRSPALVSSRYCIQIRKRNCIQMNLELSLLESLVCKWDANEMQMRCKWDALVELNLIGLNHFLFSLIKLNHFWFILI